MSKLANQRIVISGGSRGIGEAIIQRAAKDGAIVAILAKTGEPHPKLPGTIYDAAKKVEKAGGKALPLVVDVRDEEKVEDAVRQFVDKFGGVDVVINNASAIFPVGTLQLPMKQYDLMMDVNARGTFALTKACLPHLLKSKNPHILTLSPPLNLKPEWLAAHAAYTASKMTMSMFARAWAEEFKEQGVASNCLWPRTLIQTAAIVMLEKMSGEQLVKGSRSPDIVADAAYAILTQDSRSCTGNFFIDEEVLRAQGVTDFKKYAVNPKEELITDLFLE